MSNVAEKKDEKKELILNGGESFALIPKSLQEVQMLAEMISKSELAPKAYKGKPGDVAIAILMGLELGFKPIQALQVIAVVNGNPSIFGDGAKGLCESRNDVCEYIKEMTFKEIEKAQMATCEAKRIGRKDAVVHTFSVDDAKRAQLWGDGKDNWKKYPWRMLQMRARGFALRDAFPDVMKGMKLYEEIDDNFNNQLPDSPKRTSELKEAEVVKPEQPSMRLLDGSGKPITVEALKPKTINETQRKEMFSLAKSQNIENVILLDHIKSQYQCESSADLIEAQFDEIMAWLNGNETL